MPADIFGESLRRGIHNTRRGVLTGRGQLLAPPAGDNGAHGLGHKLATGRAAAGVAVGMAADQRKEIEQLWRQNRRHQQLLELQAEKAALRTTPNLDKADI